MARHFISQNDLGADEIREVFRRTESIKPLRHSNGLLGRTLVMFFEKPSTRTRLSFEIAMTQLGGHAVYLDRESSQLSRGESIGDMARVVSRYADLMMARVYSHQTVVDLAAMASIPVLNGLSDDEHPCQTMADLFTILEHKKRVDGEQIAYVGDGANNVSHSLLLGSTRLGAHIRIGAPTGLQPHSSFVAAAEENARNSGGSVTVTEDPIAAVTDADVVYTDVWVSMGQEANREQRLSMLGPYQVNRELVARAKPDFLFMHCLPAHVGDEVTEEVAYGNNSVIFDQAENRLHVQKALMMYLLEERQGGN